MKNILKWSLASVCIAGLAGCIVLPQQMPQPVAIAVTSALPALPTDNGAVGAPALNDSHPAAPPVPTGMWYCEWFANRSLLGQVAYTATVPALQFEWAAPPLQDPTPDGFSMRCVSSQALDGPQNHRFVFRANGGLRMFLDGQLVLRDQWRAGYKALPLDLSLLTSKQYVLRLEYYNASGGPDVSLTHEPQRFDAWRGQYFNEPTRSSTPVRISNDGLYNDNLILHWGNGAPPGVNPDHFSAIWEQTIKTVGGEYRFWGDADDELKIFVDGKLLCDNGGKAGPFECKIKLRRGAHLVEVHYAEYTGEAHLVLQWGRATL